MSSPVTTVYSADLGMIILAAAALRAAHAVQAGYAEAANLRQRYESEREQNQKERLAAEQAGAEALAAEREQLEARYQQLTRLSEPYGIAQALRATQPARPVESAPQTQVAHVQQLRLMCQNLESALRDVLGEMDAAIAAESTDALVFDDLIEQVARTDFSAAPISSEAIAVRPEVALRLLAHIASLGELPQRIDELAKELSACTQADRALLLELELRREISLFQENAVHQASAVVLEQTLKDLGYQVEPISETLFVSGGMIHFQRSGWGNYMVRLRLDAKKATANFNVIKAVDEAKNERSVLDHLAEDRWCTEFPALLKALGERGLNLDVTRQEKAGDYPVQLVLRSQLPNFAKAEEAHSAVAPLQKGLS